MSTSNVSAEQRLRSLSKEKTELLRRLRRRQIRDTHQITPHVRDQQARALLPASWAQQRLWFVDELEGGSAQYNIALSARLRGPLRESVLRQAFDTILQRHEILRAVFVAEGGQPRLRITPQAHFALRVFALSGRGEAQLERKVLQHRRQEVSDKFDLHAGPLVRGRLLQLGAEDHVLLITMHHTVSDGWSLNLLINELAELYTAYVNGDQDSLPPLPIQYVDYAQWQGQALQSEVLQKQVEYWRGRLTGAPPQLELPTDRPRPATQSYRGENHNFALDELLTARLKQLAQRQGMTLFMVLLTGWSILLSRLSNQHDVVIGTPVANRQRPELEGLIGFFVNTLALRVEPRSERSVIELLQEVRAQTLEAFDHQGAPFEKVVEAVQPHRSLSRNPLFQVTFGLHTTPKQAVRFDGLSVHIEDEVDEPARFDLALSLEPRGQRLAGSVNYAVDLFERQTIERWMKCFSVLLAGMADDPNRCVWQLPLLPEPERRQLFEAFNAEPVAFPADTLIHEQFEYQAATRPRTVAVVCGEQSLTFDQLNARANQLARQLRDIGVDRDQLVAVCTERSLDMIVAILAVLKAGGAYVPLDPSYPTERIAHIVRDTEPKAVVTQGSHRHKFPDGNVLALDEDWSEIARHANGNLSRHALGLRPDHLAYVIYTSGSTGVPKGVMIEHRSVLGLWQGLERHIYRGAGDCQRIAVNASFSFDASVKQIIQLLSGRTLVLISQEARLDPALLIGMLDETRVDGIDCTPSQLRSWIAAGFLDRDSAYPRVVLIGGEPIDAQLWARLGECPHIQFYNVYGPTECTVDATVCRVTAEDREPHLGRPMENKRIYVLDQHRQPVPVGVPGELYIGGIGVARGYLNAPMLSSSRFVTDAFERNPHTRMYKTGDLARWRPGGTIVYLGRNDDQVKLRGYRIELGEIESLLARHSQVKQAVVTVREDVGGVQRLVAYVTSRGNQQPDVVELRSHLQSLLPEHMLPGAFVVLDALPLTANGKLDRRALPAPEISALVTKTYEPPQGRVEQLLASIWQELLGVERVGRHDNFFELGGHSLLIVQVMDRLRQHELSGELRRVFERPVLADFATALTGRSAPMVATLKPIPKNCAKLTPDMLSMIKLGDEELDGIAAETPGGAGNVQDIYPLSPLQEGILFHHLYEKQQGAVYVGSALLSVASRKQLDQLIAAWQQVIDRHDALRTAILWERLPQPVQVVYRKALLPVAEVTLTPGTDPIGQLKAHVGQNGQRIDLRRAPLLRLTIAEDVSNARWLVLMQMHHLVSDHVSRAIVLAEVLAILEGRARDLPEPQSYRTHVAQAPTEAQMRSTEEYFRSRLADIEEPTAPFGLLDVHGDGSRVEQVERPVPAELARRVRQQARRLGVSPATMFHAAWALVVSCTSGRDDVVFGSVLLGRMQGNAETQRAVGLFLNTLPLRLSLDGLTAESLIACTRRELVGLLEHEQASLAVAQRCSGVGDGVPLFTALLNYRHTATPLESAFSSSAGVTFLEVENRTNYPLLLSVDDLNGEFALDVEADRSIDAQRIANYMQTALSSLMDALERAPQTPAVLLTVMPDSERAQVLQDFNATGCEFPRETLIHELLEAQVARTPNATALIHEQQSVAFAELNARANRLARYLLSQGLRHNDLVGICLDRGVDMVVGLLGILKAGGAYLPLDPSYPADRLRYMLEDAQPRLVVTQEKFESQLQVAGMQMIVLGRDAECIAGFGTENITRSEREVRTDNLLYVIYTSGSTGRPKGTMMAHRSMVNLIEWHRSYFPRRNAARVLQFAALSFDVAFQEIFSTLALGGTLILLDEWVRRDARALTELLRSQSVQRLFVPPLMLQTLAEFEHGEGESAGPQHLQDIITAGEQLRLSPEIVSFFRRRPDCRLHNHYGPTETHVVTALTLEGDPERWPLLPAIGRPVANTQIYVLDKRRQAVPVGVVGEIHIGGANVARGYLDRAELTSQRFVTDPFSADPNARMYRTGDLGCWRADGELEYLGRADDQVKIRGYRIELGEIESQLTRHPQVKEAAVVAREDVQGDRRLVAYVTLRAQHDLPVAELRDHLLSALPGYMVPSAFVLLDTLPVTPSGKLNRRALPAPQLGSDGQSHQPPEGEIEAMLAEIWRELLRVARVSRDDNFFALGGHSLLATRVVTRIERALGIDLPLRVLFDNPTLRALGDHIAVTLAEEIASEASA